ncbi:hypothetical protein [Streptomyces sp. NPDC059597]|uniref:hypothetical protein n=1 Tax=Streptomyces sp. NPDC059597 TaxID=3346879 RepID=UPI003675DB51
MSSEREYEAGAYDAHEADGAAPVPPVVYRPQPAEAPSYDGYADPAAAHGWQKAYDATRELPVIAPLVEPPPAPPAPEGSRAAARRRRDGGRRRVAVAGAVVGTVGAAAAIAGLVASSSGGDRPATSDRATPGVSEVSTGLPDAVEPQSSASVNTPTTAPSSLIPLRATTPVAAPSSAASHTSASASPEKVSPTAAPTASTALPSPTGSFGWPTHGGGGRHRHHW